MRKRNTIPVGCPMNDRRAMRGTSRASVHEREFGGTRNRVHVTATAPWLRLAVGATGALEAKCRGDVAARRDGHFLKDSKP